VKKAWGGWWLIAIFLLLPGGLIAWAVVKKENPAKAGRLLLVSLLATAFVFYAIVQNIIN
jgi:apolipoprotein N-acyltransferase